MSVGESPDEISKGLMVQARQMDASGDTAGAKRLYDAVLALTPDNALAYQLRGNCLLNLAKATEAIDDYTRALTLRPDGADILYNRAVAKKALGRLDDALEDLGQVLSINGNHFNALMVRGDVLIEFGRLAEAQPDYERAKAIHPESVAAHYRHGKATLLQKDGVDDRRAMFEYVYRERAWGGSGDPSDPYYSGSGTRVPARAKTYLAAVGAFLQPFEPRLNAVDIGCGDFVIGSQLRTLCDRYVACDVVPGLIEHNQRKYADLDVDFRALDAVKDPLPEGDVVFIREVLQHLSNSDISQIVDKVSRTYRYAIISESLPNAEGFTPNLDKVTSEKIRANVNGSGVILTKPPFNLACQEDRLLCVAPAGRTSIVTRLYVF